MLSNWGDHKATLAMGAAKGRSCPGLKVGHAHWGISANSVPQRTGPRITLCAAAALSNPAARAGDGLDVADEPGAAVAASENDFTMMKVR